MSGSVGGVCRHSIHGERLEVVGAGDKGFFPSFHMVFWWKYSEGAWVIDEYEYSHMSYENTGVGWKEKPVHD